MDGPSRTPHRNPSHAARRLFPLVLGAVLAASGTLAAPVARLLPAPAAQAAGTFADPFFREFAVFTGLNKPVAIRFASDGRAFVAEKGGVLKAFDSITDTTPVTVLDIRSEVNSYWDRGLLGIALDPDFLTGSPFIYLFYVYDAPPGQTAPVWNDVCPSSPSGPGGTADGCPATSKLERIRVDLSTNLMVPGSRTELIHDWCQQFPSHSGGGLAFGPDGRLYLSTGDGASFTISDYGQRGGTIPDPVNPYTEVNPCGDPVTVTSPPDTTPTVDVTTAEGGSLRAQDIRTSGDPVGLDGTLIRIDPTTGIASAGNPLAASADENSRRIVAHGFRNPFRLAFRPGTSEIYLGDVGNQAWEEIEKVVLPGGAATTTTLPNFGWPCYEGPEVSSWQTFNTNMCNALYAQGSGAITTPLYAYSHVAAKTPVGPCWAPDVTGKMGSAVTGLAFYEGPTGGAAAYPSRYTNGLFFVDYTRHCMAFIPAGPGGIPDASQEAEVARNIGGPVDLVTGPGGDLYYVDLDGNRVMRLRYLLAPIARATATPPISNAPVVVRLDASSSTDPDPGFTLDSWAWDLDNDGQYDDASGATYDWSITTAAIYPISLKVTSTNGLSDTVDLIVNAANDPPVPVISTPSSSLTWSVGDTIPFSGSATDTQDGAIPAADLEWDIVMLHCPADCHEHVIETFTGVASGSFPAPDHDYPSRLLLRLTARDSAGVAAVTTEELLPKTTTLSIGSSPTGVPISIGSDTKVSPSTTTVIRNGDVSVAAPVTRTIGGARHRFSTWNDTQARVRDVTVSAPVSLTATYVPDAPDTCATATTSSAQGSWLSDRASGNGDVDWFRFSLASKRRVVVTLGNLPVDARLDLYSTCSTLIASSNYGGTRFEELTRLLAAGTYRVRVSIAGDAWSGSAYSLRFRPMSSGMSVKSARVTAGAGGGGVVRIVGEALNNTGATTGAVTVTATFRNGSGTVVGTLKGYGFARRLANADVTPFLLRGSLPAYSTISYKITAGAPGSARSLSVGTITATTNPDSTVTEQGSVKNTGSTTLTGVGVARTWYGKLGEVLDRGIATASPSTLAPGQSGAFTVLRPVLTSAQSARTQLRAS